MIRSLIALAILVVTLSCEKPIAESVSFKQISSSVSNDLSSTGGVSFFDLNNDDYPDLYVSNGYDMSNPASPKAQRNRIYINQNGTFVEDTTSTLSYNGTFTSGSSWADFDNDGDQDVFIVNQQNQNNQFFINKDGFFEELKSGPLVEGGGHSYSSEWVDVDGDGWLDLFVGNGGLSHRGPDFIFRNKRDNTFERIDCEITKDTTATVGGIWADFNGDNKTDFFLTNQFGPEVLFINEGGWKFTRKKFDRPNEANVYPNASATAADFDNDGDLDIFLCVMYGGFNSLYINDGSANFTIYKSIHAFPEGGHSYLAQWSDFDNDGWQDLIVMNWNSSPVIYKNNSGNFSRINVPNLTDQVLFPATMACADIQNDGKIDFVIGQWPNFSGEYCRNLVFENTSILENNWIKIKLSGEQSNHSAIGAKILVTTTNDETPTTQLKVVTTTPSWRSQSDLVQHFGLGRAETIKEIKVLWPSGSVSILNDIKSNQTIEIAEEPG